MIGGELTLPWAGAGTGRGGQKPALMASAASCRQRKQATDLLR